MNLTVQFTKKEAQKLKRLAIRYGLSLDEFVKLVLKELFLKFPEDSFNNYQNPKKLKASFKKALKEWKEGKVDETL